ncbi:MAG TPA: AAA family ATPase [Steroidobacteraceae bacterium]|nr:AAA family ATPase [Steroidobacteraceae bacterium]
MAGLSIGVVGGLRVTAGDGRALRITSRKAQALLGCLALEPGTPMSRDLLASLLWEDSDPELARASLRQALAALRKALPDEHVDSLRSDAGAVWLDGSKVETDLAGFRAGLRAGSFDASAAEVPVEELLAGLEAKSIAFDQWLEQQRRVFRRQCIEALEHVAARCGATGDLEGQRIALERLLTLEPVNERAHRALMDVLAKEGRWTDALRQYRTCRDVLRRELDVSTEPATDAIHREIMRRRRSADPSAPVDESEGIVVAEPVERASASSPLLRDAVVLCVRLAADDAEYDVEQVRSRALAFARQVETVVQRFGGRLDTAGAEDAIAVFGLEAMTGNEDERAVRAALALATSPRVAGSNFSCGVEAGQVLPGRAGETVPLGGRAVTGARQLARGAAAGEVLVSNDLLARLRERFAHEPRTSPGTPSAHRVTPHAMPDAQRAARPFVGRRAELALLTSLLDRVTTSSRGRVVVVRGEPGIGKSAIIEALAHAAVERGIARHVLRVFDFGQSALERPIPALVARLVGVEPGHVDGDAVASVDAAVTSGRVAPEDRTFVLDLIGATESDGTGRVAAMDNATRERGRAAALQRVVQCAATEPLLLVVEDAHWAEPMELAALADLAAALASRPVLLTLSVRADDDPLGPSWRARIRGCPMTTLDLAPLDRDESVELAAAHGQWTPETLERCVELAGGHPLFLEQLLRASASGESSLPGSVRALLLRRVERLDPALQQALQAAAVLGHRFDLEALRHLLGAPGFDLTSLEASGLVTPDADERRFAHALIRDAVYESLLGSTRRDLHRRAAAWFAARDAGLSADHLAAAGDPAASAAYVRASSEQLQGCRLERALAYAERATELARDPKDHAAARATLGDVQLALGRAVEACSTYRNAIELAVDPESRARGWLGLATALRILDRHDEALTALGHAERDLDPHDHRRQARLWTLRGNLHFPRGELDLCLDSHRRALYHARQGESLEDVVRAFGGLGDAQYQRGRMRSAAAEFRRCVDLAEQHRMVGLRLAYLPMVACTEIYMAELESALATCNVAVAAAVEQRDRRALLLAEGIAGSARLQQGEYAAAHETSLRCIDIARELGARRFEAENHVLRGLALLGLGESRRAREVLEGAADASRATSATYCGPWAIVALALSAWEEESFGRELLVEGERLLARGCVSHNYLEFHHYAMELCGRWQDWDELRRHADALEAYTREEPLPWVQVIVGAHRAIAEAGSTPGAGAARAVEAALQVARASRFLTLVPLLEQAAGTRH